MTTLSNKDLELAKKHGYVEEVLTSTCEYTRLEFMGDTFAAFLTERDQLAIKEKDDAVRELIEAATVANKLLAGEGIYPNAWARLDNAIRTLIEPKE